MKNIRRNFLLAAVLLTTLATTTFTQNRAVPDAELIEKRNKIEAELQDIAVVDRKVMVPMRDGTKMAADIYRPKDASKKYPIIFSRTPYNFNFWDVKLGAPRDMTTVLDAVKRGYAYVIMNERGHFFSEGNYDILGAPLSDGDDAIKWMSAQDWSNKKVGTIGCSSTAEWQPAVASLGNPNFTTMIVQGFGAGIGRVGPYYEQGNWYRGGAVQMLFIAWLYGEQNQVRPMFPAGTSQADLIRASKSFDLAQQSPPVDWSKALNHLPMADIMKAVDGPTGIYADKMPVDTGGAMIKRTPNDPAWYKGGLWNDGMKINIPGFWFASWYDVSIGPNIAAYNQVRKTADPEIADKQYLVIAPTSALQLYESNRKHNRRRTLDGRRAARLRCFDLRLVRPFLKGRRQRSIENAEGSIFYDGQQQMADRRLISGGGFTADEVLSFEWRQSEFFKRRRCIGFNVARVRFAR